jgi:hypothetical protein
VSPKLAKTWNMRKGKLKVLDKTFIKKSSFICVYLSQSLRTKEQINVMIQMHDEKTMLKT